MIRRGDLLLISVAVCLCSCLAHTQTGASGQPVAGLRVVMVAPEKKSDSVITIPPAAWLTVRPGSNKHAAKMDFGAWLQKEQALNGLESTGLPPWHIKVAYDQFDEDGDNFNSGEYEEFWAGPQKYKRIYKSDKFNQADYATAQGLFRSGDQEFAGIAETQVREEIVAPFFYAATLQGYRARTVERTFSGYTLQCVLIENKSMRSSDPPQYCFEPDGAVLRYARGSGWFQTTYNEIVSFEGRNVAREVEVTDGGKPYLRLRVETLEAIPQVEEAAFVPPADAVAQTGKRVSGVRPVLLRTSTPIWPDSLRGRSFSLQVAIVIGKDGHVISAHALSGPPEAQKSCEEAVLKWVFSPYRVLGEPVEVETKIEFSHF